MVVLPTDVVVGGVGCLVGWLVARDSSADCIPAILVTREAIVSFMEKWSSMIFSIWGFGVGVGWVEG